MNTPQTSVTHIAKSLKQRFAGHAKQVIVFGSQARGDATHESDVDCLLVVDHVTPAVKAELEQLGGQYLLQEGIVLSCIPISEADWTRLRFEPFLLNAKKEGVVL